MEDLIIGGVTIKHNQNVKINLAMPKLYNTPTQLPIRVIRGKKNGPIVFISAAIHGDELCGIEIIRRLTKIKNINKIKGTLILIPIVNIYGNMALSRYLPDRRDLNRSFPGSPKGSLAARVAQIFFDEIVSKCDFGIDLHTAAIHKSNLPQVRINTSDDFALNLAKKFAAPVILHSELRDGSLRAVAEESGIPVLLYEAGSALRFDEKSIRIGVKGVINILKEVGMLYNSNKKKTIKTPVLSKTSQWIRATHGGMIRTVKTLGNIVEKGEVVAYIDDIFEDTSFEVFAPFDGIIIGKTEIPLTWEGDAVLHIAKFGDLDVAEDKIEYFEEEIITNNFPEIGDNTLQNPII